jgi:hypothetical protein
MIMTDNEFVGKYQNALSDLCGVDCAYMQGDPAVDTLVELIRLAVEQKAEIERLKDKVKRLQESIRLMLNYDDGDERIKAEAIKEFAERLKKKVRKYTEYDEGGWGMTVYSVEVGEIDNLVKEMEKDK